MSIATDCPSCALGSHDRHDRGHGLRPGLIGGSYCGCTGDCAERFEADADSHGALWGLPPLAPVSEHEQGEEGGR